MPLLIVHSPVKNALLTGQCFLVFSTENLFTWDYSRQIPFHSGFLMQIIVSLDHECAKISAFLFTGVFVLAPLTLSPWSFRNQQMSWGENQVKNILQALNIVTLVWDYKDSASFCSLIVPFCPGKAQILNLGHTQTDMGPHQKKAAGDCQFISP